MKNPVPVKANLSHSTELVLPKIRIVRLSNVTLVILQILNMEDIETTVMRRNIAMYRRSHYNRIKKEANKGDTELLIVIKSKSLYVLKRKNIDSNKKLPKETTKVLNFRQIIAVKLAYIMRPFHGYRAHEDNKQS